MKIRDKQIVRKILEEINVAEAIIEASDLDYFYLMKWPSVLHV